MIGILNAGFRTRPHGMGSLVIGDRLRMSPHVRILRTIVGHSFSRLINAIREANEY